MDGTLTVTQDWSAGDNVVAMIYDATGRGPFAVARATGMASDGGDGASGVWSMSICSDLGAQLLLGAHDTNGNGLIDPSDTWGSYVLGGGAITVDTRSDRHGLSIEVPRNGGRSGDQGVRVTTFVTLSGTIGVNGGTFNDLPSGTSVYVVALRYAPGADVAVTTLLRGAYGYEAWDWASLAGQSSLPWSLRVPEGTTTYLWAFTDLDGDGLVNEDGEPISSVGSFASRGAVETTASRSYNLMLTAP